MLQSNPTTGPEKKTKNIVGLYCVQLVIVVKHTKRGHIRPIRVTPLRFDSVPIVARDCLLAHYKNRSFTYLGAQWLSGRVFDSRPRGRGFEPHRRHCVVVLE